MSIQTNLTRLSVFVGFSVLSIACGSKSSSQSPATSPLTAPLNQTADVPAGAGPISQNFNGGPIGANFPGAPLEQPVGANVAANAAASVAAQGANVAASTTVAAGGGAVVSGGSVTVAGGAIAATPPPAPRPQTFSIGRYYAFTVPQNMHMQEYTTNWNVQGTPQFYMVHNDPTYIGNYRCAGPFDLAQIIPNAVHDPMSYCYTAPPTDLLGMQNWVMSNHQALNHILVASNPGNSWNSIDINLFDEKLPYERSEERGRSKFDFLCAGQLIQATPVIPIMPSFWGNAVHTVMLSCQAPVVVGGLTAAGSSWVNAYITTFYVSATALPNLVCFNKGWGGEECGLSGNPYRNSSLLEVTVIQQITGLTQNQANQQAQLVFQAGLRQTTPLLAQ